MTELTETPQQTFENKGTNAMEQKGLIHETIQVNLDRADTLKNSQEIYQQEAYARAMNVINEVNQYIELGLIDRAQADTLIASRLAETEIEGRIDPITSTLNKKGLNERLLASMGHAARTGEPLTIAYVDLKGFKAINDIIGHNAGDKVLRFVADFFKQEITLRPEDFSGRIGGDEFVHGLSGEEDLLRELKFNIDILENQLSNYVQSRMMAEGIDPKGILVTARAGVTSYQEGDTLESILDRADKEMNAQRELAGALER